MVAESQPSQQKLAKKAKKLKIVLANADKYSIMKE
tara:strand:- start:369 stop:473 length:105 start_codon:yes stop_codon:yes gene_type:complete